MRNYDQWKLSNPFDEEEFYYQECPECGNFSEDGRPCCHKCYKASML